MSALGLGEADALQFAERYAWNLAVGTPSLVVAPRLDSEALEAGLDAPHAGACEAEPAPTSGPGASFQRHLLAGGIGLWLRTDTAHHNDVALLFSDAVGRRLLDQAREVVPDFCLALHEAVANALIHGNLEIASPGDGIEAFQEYCRLLDERLEDERWAGRRVGLSAARLGEVIEVAVRNEGPGYDTRAHRPHKGRRGGRKRGLTLISDAAELAVEEGGQLALLRFPIRPRGPVVSGEGE